MKCEFREGETRQKRVKRQHWSNGALTIVENVSAEVCAECGERYFHARTLDEIDDYLSKQHEVKARLNVEVVRLGLAVA
uniref:YgiT-type zinc finger domain-containing protein n=1 Tax=Candidatus Kentrum sp. TC TaxID=2126339 RepID=A0A450ZSK2_9GAMM|nr:MAG: YgiT-type zinc finger domain-containing protein [Candidatus Kentron sp. TC]VFK56759.1 MAG: YgiT-type zinc finger domain-containing protein [Candidatus Kentron sp. TC]